MNLEAVQRSQTAVVLQAGQKKASVRVDGQLCLDFQGGTGGSFGERGQQQRDWTPLRSAAQAPTQEQLGNLGTEESRRVSQLTSQ